MASETQAKPENSNGTFKNPPFGAILSALVLTALLFVSLFQPLLMNVSVNHPANLDLMNAFFPPLETNPVTGDWFLLGTDDQGRDLFVLLVSGLRISLTVGFASIALAMGIGVTLGLIAGYKGGVFDQLIMRIADVQLTFPPILVAMLIFGMSKGIMTLQNREFVALWVLVFSIGLSGWVQFARATRAAVKVEKTMEYVDAARVMGLGSAAIVWRHILPNILPPIRVLATLSLAMAIVAEATLSFLGVGMPPTQPSLGTLVRTGQGFLLSGEWWVLFFPACVLLVLALAVNVLGDWLGQRHSPRTRLN